MGLEKLGMSLAQRTSAWLKACGKSNILQTNPIKPAELKGLSFAPELNMDTVSLNLSTQRWLRALKNNPDVSPGSYVAMHHWLEGKNLGIRATIKNIETGRVLKQHHLLTLQDILLCDEAFNKLPSLASDCVVYRARRLGGRADVDFDIVKNADVGDVIVPDKGYSYTGFTRSIAEHWAPYDRSKGMMYIIRLPKGCKVSRNLEHGGEVVMPRGAEYRVISKHTNYDGTLEVTMEYIPPKTDNSVQSKEWCQMFGIKPYSKEEALEMLEYYRTM